MGAPTDPSPQTPRHVALVDASATAPTSTLLADAAEALPEKGRVSSSGKSSCGK